MNDDDLFIWQQLKYDSRTDWIAAGKPIKALQKEPECYLVKTPVKTPEEIAFEFINRNSYMATTTRDGTSLHVRDKERDWICTINLKRQIIYWNSNKTLQNLIGFRSQYQISKNY